MLIDMNGLAFKTKRKSALLYIIEMDTVLAKFDDGVIGMEEALMLNVHVG